MAKVSNFKPIDRTEAPQEKKQYTDQKSETSEKEALIDKFLSNNPRLFLRKH